MVMQKENLVLGGLKTLCFFTEKARKLKPIRVAIDEPMQTTIFKPPKKANHVKNVYTTPFCIT